MGQRFFRLFIRPVGMFFLAAIIVGIIIVVVGETLLGAYNPDFTSELARLELWIALGLAILIMALCAFLATRPAGSMGALDKDLAIGKTSITAPEPAGLSERARQGVPGTLADIKPGDVLYAQNGPLARVLGVLPGEEEYGRRRRGLIYATGLFGASSELWIPVEAVLEVYPESGAIFLAAKGDETEHFGWNLPPESFRRDGKRGHQPPSSF